MVIGGIALEILRDLMSNPTLVACAFSVMTITPFIVWIARSFDRMRIGRLQRNLKEKVEELSQIKKDNENLKENLKEMYKDVEDKDRILLSRRKEIENYKKINDDRDREVHSLQQVLDEKIQEIVKMRREDQIEDAEYERRIRELANNVNDLKQRNEELLKDDDTVRYNELQRSVKQYVKRLGEAVSIEDSKKILDDFAKRIKEIKIQGTQGLTEKNIRDSMERFNMEKSPTEQVVRKRIGIFGYEF